MQYANYKKLWFSEAAQLISLDDSRVFSTVNIDNFHFRLTQHPMEPQACVLWFRDNQSGEPFEVLGKFGQYDKRNVLDFMVRYSTNSELRAEVARRIFARRIDDLSPAYFKHLQNIDERAKEKAYRNLFDLDTVIEKNDLVRRRKIMAKKFHPDAGGDHQAMLVINEAYDYLVSRSRA